MADPFRLDGRVAVLTGGAGILGAEMTKGLLDAGASVAIVDRDAARIDALVARHADVADRIHGLACDIADRAAVEDARIRIEALFGRADILVNNAATKSEHFFEPFETFPDADWDAVMAVNVKGAVHCCQAFGGAMAQAGRGSIINTLSVYGIVAPDQRIYEGSLYEGRSINTPAVYSASKAALWGLTKYLASYWGTAGVRVNAVTPGGAFSGQNDTFVERYSARVPMARMAQPRELAPAVVFLGSDASSYVTGQNIIVDGGLSTW